MRSAGPGSPSVWERPEPVARAVPVPLSRERIVRTAIAIADADGLAAVSMRSVGAALSAGPMRLYGYVATKEELLDVMVDAVYAEMAIEEPLSGDWRSAFRLLAQRMRQAAEKHGWFAELLGGRPHQGPSALHVLESWFASAGTIPGVRNAGAILQATKTISAYVIGAIRSEASERRAQRESGMDKEQWQAATEPYIRRMIATGRFPTTARVFRDADHLPPNETFELGLQAVLDGLAARRRR
jgi:AcrR family transcriptional regulator